MHVLIMNFCLSINIFGKNLNIFNFYLICPINSVILNFSITSQIRIQQLKKFSSVNKYN